MGSVKFYGIANASHCFNRSTFCFFLPRRRSAVSRVTLFGAPKVGWQKFALPDNEKNWCDLSARERDIFRVFRSNCFKDKDVRDRSSLSDQVLHGQIFIEITEKTTKNLSENDENLFSGVPAKRINYHIKNFIE